ncbi:MAG: prolipoprotein diacylglyceryl transferase [Isosphaeraceae bacterium]
MKQILFEIPGLGFPVYGFGLMVVAAFYTALALAVRRAGRERLNPDSIYDVALWMLVGGVIGARLFYVVEYWGDRIHTVSDVFKIWEGGVVFYGGLVGGFLGFFWAWRSRRFPLLPTLDALAPSVAIGGGIGRIGCFLNGCCYGDVCAISAISVRFPKGSPPWNAERARGLIGSETSQSLPLHPTQLYSAIDGLLLFLLLQAFYPRRRRDGEVFALWMVAYPISRFLIERLRDDESALYAGMTVSQLVSVALLTGGLAFWGYLRTQPKGVLADRDGRVG